METRKSVSDSGCARVGSYAIIAVLMSGCFHTAPVKPTEPIRVKSETELAVAAIDREWLKRCEGLKGPMPANEVGALLQEHAASTLPALAECMKRHNSLVEYLIPVVEKERQVER
jgi:hypothetical protein